MMSVLLEYLDLPVALAIVELRESEGINQSGS